jgi:hypothetical protein
LAYRDVKMQDILPQASNSSLALLARNWPAKSCS